MADPMSGAITRCPWCSTELPDPTAEQCPTCGAMLIASPDAGGDIKGVTTLDTEAILRARSEVSRPRSNRLLSFITGEVPQEEPASASPGSVAPPDNAVRLEMLRLQAAAETADLEAEAVALKADELARRGIHLSELGSAAPDAPPSPADDVAAVEVSDTPDPEAEASQPGLGAAAADVPDGDAEPAGTWPEELTPSASQEPPTSS